MHCRQQDQPGSTCNYMGPVSALILPIFSVKLVSCLAPSVPICLSPDNYSSHTPSVSTVCQDRVAAPLYAYLLPCHSQLGRFGLVHLSVVTLSQPKSTSTRVWMAFYVNPKMTQKKPIWGMDYHNVGTTLRNLAMVHTAL